MNKILLIDGNAIIHRAYHAFPNTMSTTMGEPTNATYGFAMTFLNVIYKFKPSHIVVAFDVKGKTFRHKQFAGYKANRPKMDEQLVVQLNRIKQFVEIMNVPSFGITGFEADDIIGTISKQITEFNHTNREDDQYQTIIVTGDKDSLQLLDNYTNVYFPARGRKIPEKIYNPEIFKQEYLFDPIKLIDFKALAGDSSDEIPGVRGVGPKTATALITQYGYLEDIYNNLHDIKGNIRSKLKSNKENAFMSKMLATIIRDIELDFSFNNSKLSEYDKDKAEDFMLQMEFKSLLSRLPESDWTINPQKIVKSKITQIKPENVVSKGQIGLF